MKKEDKPSEVCTKAANEIKAILDSYQVVLEVKNDILVREAKSDAEYTTELVDKVEETVVKE